MWCFRTARSVILGAIRGTKPDQLSQTGHVWEPTGSGSTEVSQAVSTHWVFIYTTTGTQSCLCSHPASSLLPKMPRLGGCVRELQCTLLVTPFSFPPSPFSHPASQSWDLGGFPAAQRVMASPPQPSPFLASLFLLPLIPFSQRHCRPGQMCSLVRLKQLPALPTPSKHLQEPAAGFLPVLELLAIPVPNPAQGAPKNHPRAPGSAGEGSCSSAA